MTATKSLRQKVNELPELCGLVGKAAVLGIAAEADNAIESLREALRISRQSETEAWRYEPELEAAREALQAKVDRLSTRVAELMFGDPLTHGIESLLAAIEAEDAARAAWDECGCGTPEFDRWTRATDLRRMHATWVRIVAKEFRRRVTKEEESV